MTLTRYVTGFILSILCTVAAFGLVELHVHTGHQWPTHAQLILIIFVLALVQIIAQLACFLHVDFTKGNRERLVVLSGAFVVVCILLSGSLWIMFTLSGRMMPGQAEMQDYMESQGGF